jgi:hypothetical protein
MFNTEGAACIGLDPELFFPDSNMSPKIEGLLRKTCMGCPVFDNCLDYALKVKVNGYWAGTTDARRVELRRFFKITPVRIDEEYKRKLEPETNQAKNSRNYRARQREAGAR